ncbi:Aspartate--tRNA ligase 2, cytoplasmic-like protein [Drosera capensis]
MDAVDRLFVAIFYGLKESCSKERETIGSQYPFTTPEYLLKTLSLTFKEGVEMLKVWGTPSWRIWSWSGASRHAVLWSRQYKNGICVSSVIHSGLRHDHV